MPRCVDGVLRLLTASRCLSHGMSPVRDGGFPAGRQRSAGGLPCVERREQGSQQAGKRLAIAGGEPCEQRTLAA